MDKANIIESIDVLEAQRDLLDVTRRDDVFNQMLEINRLLGEVAVFPSLLWAWTFDVIKISMTITKRLPNTMTMSLQRAQS